MITSIFFTLETMLLTVFPDSLAVPNVNKWNTDFDLNIVTCMSPHKDLIYSVLEIASELRKTVSGIEFSVKNTFPASGRKVTFF